jgi:hypothetical protein
MVLVFSNDVPLTTEVAVANFCSITSRAIAGGELETKHEGDKNVVLGKYPIGGAEVAAS